MPPGTTIIATLTLLAAVSSQLRAHGGQYRGPGNVVPPSAASSGAAFRGPGDVLPTTGATSGGARTGGAAPTARSGPARAASGAVARGYQVGDDLGRWEFWWEFGKDPFLDLRNVIYSASDRAPELQLFNPRVGAAARDVTAPNAADVREVASAIAALLATTRDRDTCSACAIALAKIGSDRAGFRVDRHLLPLLRRGDQELRETAALSMGISGELGDEAVARLLALISDDPGAHKLTGKGVINERTRAFAAFGAGLLLQRSRKAAVSLRLVRGLQRVIDEAPNNDRNLVVAAIEALGLFPQEWRGAAAGALRDDIVACLGRYYRRSVGVGRELIQAHAPTAIARLVAPRSREAGAWRDVFMADLREGLRGARASKGSKANHHISQSCALALGALCSDWDDANSRDHEACALLTAVYERHRDQQTRAFAVVSLARIGGAKAQAYLLEQLPRGNKALEQPWVACALGVLAARERAHDPEALDHGGALQAISDALVRQFNAARNPSTVGAIAVALGLAGAPEAKDILRRRLMEHRKRDAIAGYVAIALGLLRDYRAVPDLREIRRGAARRAFVQLQAVQALGLLGDHTLNDQLIQELLAAGNSLVRLAGAARALGQIGDRRCLPALVQLTRDPDAGPLTRAFAAVALGSVCDKAPIPWSASYATDINYRAATATLTDGAAGILDIL